MCSNITSKIKTSESVCETHSLLRLLPAQRLPVEERMTCVIWTSDRDSLKPCFDQRKKRGLSHLLTFPRRRNISSVGLTQWSANKKRFCSCTQSTLPFRRFVELLRILSRLQKTVNATCLMTFQSEKDSQSSSYPVVGRENTKRINTTSGGKRSSFASHVQSAIRKPLLAVTGYQVVWTHRGT